MSIHVSKKHGVNPSVQKCFWCRKDIGVALFGRLPSHRAEQMFGDVAKELPKTEGEVEAPRAVVLDFNPCEGCEVWAHSKKGVFFVEMEEQVPGEVRPTGAFHCVLESAVKRMLDPGPDLDEALKNRLVYIHTDDFRQTFREAKPKTTAN